MKLPPLKSLPVFESVARLESFSKASVELNVSQSAVSHQIKLLEDYLGETLIIRSGRSIALTEQGRAYFESISGALKSIEKASAKLLGTSDRVLRLAMFSSFAVRWLIPRLPKLQEHFPHLELSLIMTSESPTLSDREADCFITIHQDNSAYAFDLIYTEQLFPICSRSYWLQMREQLSWTDEFSPDLHLAPEQVANFTLLSTYSIYGEDKSDWRHWFNAADHALPSHTRFQHFSHMLFALEAARHHQGIALTNEYMVQEEAEDREDLVRLPCHQLTTGDSFYFAYKHSRRHEPAIIAFRQWLVNEAIRSGLRDR